MKNNPLTTLFQALKARRVSASYRYRIGHPICKLSRPDSDAPTVAVRHSGHSGDVIYSLLAVKAIAEETGKRATFYLREGLPIPTDYDLDGPKPALTAARISFIGPLIEAQPYIDRCVAYESESEVDGRLDYDLDLFRKLPVNFYYGHLPLHYLHATGCFSDYASPWLSAAGNSAFDRYRDVIVVGRTARNVNRNLDYRMLNSFDFPIAFIGIPEEFEAMRSLVPRLEHLRVATALEMAQVLISCRLYIGNSSLNFAVAEGLKVRRFFEMNPEIQSLMPCAGVEYFTTTKQLQSLLAGEFAGTRPRI